MLYLELSHLVKLSLLLYCRIVLDDGLDFLVSQIGADN